MKDHQSQILNYTKQIQLGNKELLLNRAFVHYVSQQFQQCFQDVSSYLQFDDKLQAAQLYVNVLIKLKRPLLQNELKELERLKAKYNEDAKLKRLTKILNQVQIVQDDECFMQKTFEKMLCNPNIRNYVKEESFLTKVEKMIKNPSLSAVLIKMDPRLQEVQDALMMAIEQ